MCGLVGCLSSNLTPQKADIFRELLTVATVRGAYGAGIAAVEAPDRKKPNIELFRTLGTGAEMAIDAGFYKYLNKHKVSCLMGHTRMPTSGGWDLEDTHPIHARHVVGMHNGTLKVVNGVPVGTDYDSEKLFHALSNTDPVKVLASSTGSYAVTYLNKNNFRLYFARNKDRPLSFAMVDGDETTLWWASERDMLQFVLARNAIAGTKIKHYPLPPGLLLTYRVHFEGVVKYENSKPILSENLPVVLPRDSVEDLWATSKNHMAEKSDIKKILDDGCANCKHPANWDDFEKKRMLWIEPTEFFCFDCVQKDQFVQTMILASGMTLPKGMALLPPPKPTEH